MIRIVNMRNPQLNPGELMIKVDRSTVVGNPFTGGESQRNLVCDKYQEYFDHKMKSANEDDAYFKAYIEYIYNIAKDRNVALGCWCSPKRCHAETIKKYIDDRIERENKPPSRKVVR